PLSVSRYRFGRVCETSSTGSKAEQLYREVHPEEGGAGFGPTADPETRKVRFSRTGQPVFAAAEPRMDQRSALLRTHQTAGLLQSGYYRISQNSILRTGLQASSTPGDRSPDDGPDLQPAARSVRIARSQLSLRRRLAGVTRCLPESSCLRIKRCRSWSSLKRRKKT